MALPGMGSTSYEDMRGLRAAGGGPRAARPRERTFVDHEMGSLHLVGGQRGAPAGGALLGGAQPAFAKSKKSMNSNKQEGVGAAMGEEYRKKMFAEEKLAMAGDKGARGTKIDPNLRVNEQQRTGTVYVDGKKKVTADRNRDPAELGLKQWSGASGPTTWR